MTNPSDIPPGPLADAINEAITNPASRVRRGWRPERTKESAMSDPADSAPARRAYEAYAATVGGVAVNGDTLPPWDNLSGKVQEGWRSAAAEGSTAYTEQDRARAASAARQMVDQEAAGGPTERLAEAFWATFHRWAERAEAPGSRALEDLDTDGLREIFAELTRGGHLHAGRAEPTYRDRNDHYVPPKLHLDGAPRYVEVNPGRSWLDLGHAMSLLYTAWTVIANVDTKRVGDWSEQDPEWVAAATRFRDQFHEALAAHRTKPPTARVALGGADEHNGGEASSWFWADVSGDGTHWSRFEGHRVQVDVELHTFNRREVNAWKGRDEIRAEGEWRLHLNRQPMGDGHVGADVHAALRRIDDTIRKLVDHPALDHTEGRPYVEQLTGRRVYYREQPAVVVGTALTRGCVVLAPVGSAKFPPPVWAAEERTSSGMPYDDSEDGEALVELGCPHVWWWRDELPGEADWLAQRAAAKTEKLGPWHKVGHTDDGATVFVAPAGTESPAEPVIEITAEPDEDPEGTPVEREA